MNKEQATIYFDMFARISEFNNEWKKVFQRNRLDWATSQSHTFLEFAERFTVKSFHDPTEDDQRNHFQWQINTSEGRLLIRNNQGGLPGRNMLVHLKLNNRRMTLDRAIGITHEDMQVFYAALLEAGFQELVKDLLHMNEMKRWHAFVEEHQDKLQGTFEYEGKHTRPLLIIDDQAIDLTPLYKTFKQKG